jgi:hypothetical protein
MKGAGEGSPGEVPTCLLCHDGTGAVSNMKNGPGSFGGMSGHVLENVTTLAEPRDLMNSCSDSHKPHGDCSLPPELPASTIHGSTIDSTGNVPCFACHNEDQDWCA